MNDQEPYIPLCRILLILNGLFFILDGQVGENPDFLLEETRVVFLVLETSALRSVLLIEGNVCTSVSKAREWVAAEMPGKGPGEIAGVRIANLVGDVGYIHFAIL